MSDPANGYSTSALLWSDNSVTVLPTLLDGSSAIAFDINNGGVIVGDGQMSASTLYHAVRWQAGVITDLTGAGSLYGGHAAGINDSGIVVGIASIPIDFSLPSGTSVKWDAQGQATALGPEPAEATAINATGIVVGNKISGNHQEFAVAANWSPGFAVLPAPYDSSAAGINDLGQIVGAAGRFNNVITGRGSNAYLWSGGMAIDLQTGHLDVLASTAAAINEHSQIVGLSTKIGGKPHATLWEGGELIDLNSFVQLSDGWFLEQANDINEAGWIVGLARNANTNETHAFLLSAVPEPSQALLVGIGLVLVCGIALRKKRECVYAT